MTGSATPPTRSYARFLLTLACLAVAIVGYWGPWVDHFAAALVIPGFDLAEYVKFLPQVRAQAIPVTRELFYLPAPAAGLCLALHVGRMRRRMRAWAWAPLAILAVTLTLVVAPPLDFIARFPQDAGLRAEWGRQALLAAGAFGMAMSALLWADRLPRRTVPMWMTLIGGTGAAVPLWQFTTVRPAIERVYNKPVTLGWGLWLMPLGFGLLVLGSWLLMAHDPAKHKA